MLSPYSGSSYTPDSESDPDGSNQNGKIAEAGIGAAATTARSILNSIAAQNALDFSSNQHSLDLQSQGAMGNADRQTQAQNTSLGASQAALGNQLQAGGTGISAALGGQDLKDHAVMAMADRLAKLYSR